MLALPILLAALASYPGQEAPDTAGALPTALSGVGIEERLGAQVDGNLQLVDESGKKVKVGDYLGHGKPVLLNFAYFHCPMLCGLVQDAMVKGLKPLDWTPGKEYEILTVSMDWREGPEQASAAKEKKLPELGKPGAAAGWHFLTGDFKSVKSLAEKVGFHYNYLSGQNEFAHGAGLIFLSPKGTVSRYLYGVDFPTRDLRLALLNASEGKSLSLGDKIEMFCYRYDPNAKGYVLFARNFMKAGGVVVVGLLMLLLIPLWIREVKRKPLAAAPGKGL